MKGIVDMGKETKGGVALSFVLGPRAQQCTISLTAETINVLYLLLRSSYARSLLWIEPARPRLLLCSLLNIDAQQKRAPVAHRQPLYSFTPT